MATAKAKSKAGAKAKKTVKKGGGKSQTLPKRGEVAVSDTWDLKQLYKTGKAWEEEFKRWEGEIPNYAKYKGRLGESASTLAELLKFDAGFERTGERLGNYASLNASGDNGDSVYQRMKGRFHHVAVKAAEAASYIRPELLGVPQETMDSFLASAELAEWKLALERIVRYRPHTLSQHEEQILAMSGQMSDASNEIFRQLNDTDLKWPVITDEKGVGIELGHSSFSKFLHSEKRSVRKEAFHVYYGNYEGHKHTVAASLNASVQRDVFYSKVRGYSSARESSLFHDNVPVSVYDSLIEAVHKHLPTNHRYLALRRKALKIPDVHMYDTYVPMVAGVG